MRSLFAKNGHPRMVECVFVRIWNVSCIGSWKSVNRIVACSRIGTVLPSANVMLGSLVVGCLVTRFPGSSASFSSVSADITLTEAPVSTSALIVRSPILSWRYPNFVD